MKKFFKSLAATALSVAMILSPMASSNVFAADPTTSAGTGNILAYSVDSYVVPTSISVALNPQGYSVKLRDGDTAADKTTNQIVTLNYGLANLSTGDKKFKLSLSVNSANSGITFVDTEAKATTDANPGEYKMYLALVPATSTAPKTQADAAFAVDVKTGDNTHNVTAANMSDVKMTADTEHAIVFAGDGNVKAEKTFVLGKATYVVKDGGSLSFTTTQSGLADAMEISAIGDTGVSGFTLTGAMNTEANWAKLTTKSLTFTPTYEFIDVAQENIDAAAAAENEEDAEAFKTTYADVLALTADTAAGTDEEAEAIAAAAAAYDALDDAVKTILAEDDIDADLFETLAGYNTAAAAANAAPTVSSNSIAVGGNVTITLPDGVTITKIEKKKTDGSYNDLPTDYYTLTDVTGGKKLTISANLLNQYASATKIKIVFSSGDPITLDVTAN